MGGTRPREPRDPHSSRGRNEVEDLSAGVFWAIANREEPAPAGGEKTTERRFQEGRLPPIGLTPEQGHGPHDPRWESDPS